MLRAEGFLRELVEAHSAGAIQIVLRDEVLEEARLRAEEAGDDRLSARAHPGLREEIDQRVPEAHQRKPFEPRLRGEDLHSLQRVADALPGRVDALDRREE